MAFAPKPLASCETWLDCTGKLSCKHVGPRTEASDNTNGWHASSSQAFTPTASRSSTSCCNYPAVAPTHDRIDSPDAGDHVPPCCHSNPIGPFEHRRSAANVKDCPPPNSRWSCLRDGQERPRRLERAGHRHVRLDNRRDWVRSFRRLHPTRRFGQKLRSKARDCGRLT